MFCLVSIVRNEAQNIDRLLTSAAALASEYVVTDTGSTDATVEELRGHPMPGHVVHHPFVDFSDARNKSLESARILSTAEFFLLMDADMELVLGDLGALRKLLEEGDTAMVVQTHDGQGTGVLSYQNIRILRRSLAGAKYVGPTHEYLDVPPETRVVTIPESVLRIRDIGDGGCKHDKFERDTRLLTNHLAENPDDARSTFYLAESYYFGGHVEKALEAYSMRMVMKNGWEEEAAYARYRAVACLVALGRLDEACDILPEKDTRAEPLVVVARALREAGMHQEAFYLITRASVIPAPGVGALFVERNVYSYGIDGEAAVLWYYVSPPSDRVRGVEISWRVLCNPDADEGMWWCIHNNLEWYMDGPPVGARVVGAGLPEPPLVEEPWSISTPAPIGEDGVVYRIVNYNITDDGSYIMPEDGIVRTRNFLAGRGFLIDPPPPFPDANVRGFEDLRITRDPVSRRFFILAATRDHCPRGDSVSQALLTLNPATLELTVQRVLSDGSRCEKNWVWIDYPHYIYEWFPNVVIRSVEDEADERHIPSLPCMRAMRGSSNACVVDGGRLHWFITHSVIGGETSIRHYLHSLVALDLDEGRVVHVSRPFTFERGADVEYCTFLRAAPDDDRAFLAGYSKRDGTNGVGWTRLAIPVF